MKAPLRWLAPALALLLHPGVSAASPAPDAFGDAAAAYAQGRYADAARGFEAMARAHGVSAGLYYDLGAAQLAGGELAPAILSFERGRWLAPRDRGIAVALRTARERAGLPASESSGWRRARSVASADEWAATAVLALVLASAGLALTLLAPAGRLGGDRSRRLVYGITAAASVVLLVAALACVSLSAEISRAVVLAPELALRIAPFAGAESRDTLSVGESVRVEERHGEFLRVRAEGGRTGWVSEREVGAVVPG